METKTEITQVEREALAVADELRAILAKNNGRVVVHPGKLLDLAERLEAAAPVMDFAVCEHPNAVVMPGWPKIFDAPGRRDRVYRLKCPDCGAQWNHEERER